jgi:thioredoxin-like negative regulator of GroEL
MHYHFAAAPVSLLLGVLFIGVPTLAQDRQDPRRGTPDFSSDPFNDPSPDGFNTGRITGTVRTFDGHAVSNAKIEARGIERGTTYFTALSDSSGSFALYNISPGTYDVTVSSGTDEAHERVQVGAAFADSGLDIRLGNKIASPRGSGPTVSFSQYSVPPKARSLYEKAVQSMGHGKTDDSLNKVNAALAICPKFPEALTLRAMLRANAGKLNDAAADLQQAIQYDANYATAYLALAAVFNSSGRFRESLPVLGQAERLNPNLWQIYFEFARADIGTGKFAEALRNIDHSSDLQGGPQKESPEVHLVRGYALIGLNEMPQASRELETFLAREPRGESADHARILLDKLRATTITADK